MSKYIYNENLTNYIDRDQRKTFKAIKPKLRQSKRVLVTRRYEPNAITYQEENNIVGRVLNMYDYFQGTIDIPKKDLHIRLSDVFDLKQVKIVGINPNTSHVFYNGTQIAEVAIAPLSVQIIGAITWLNPVGDPISQDIYDRRGFKTSTQYYHLNGNIGHQIIYDKDGHPKLEMIMMAHNGEEQLTSIKLLNYDGADYLFANEDELWVFFKSELESKETGDKVMTVYFINEGLGTSNSGIEHAEFDRARLFRRNQVDFKIVTSNYIPNLHSILPLFAISDNESMNMFDYFQDALNIPKQSMSVDMVDFGIDVELERSGNTYLAMVHGHIIGRINVNDADNVTSVEYFDGIGNLYKVIMFDTRGFASLVQYYSPDNKIEVETWLNTDGIPVLEKTYTLNRKGNTAETWKLGNRLFNNIQELRLYFYNQINASGKNMFIMDRANVSEWQLTQLDNPAYKVFMLHNHQSSDAQNPNAALLNDNYEWTLANIDEWDAIVSATPQQTHDVQNRWGSDHKCYTIPVGVIPDIEFMDERIPMNQRKPHSMLVTARIAPEKGIDKMIEALAIARKTIPDATLDVFGYVDHGNDNLAMRRITDALKLLDDKDAVTLHKHSKNVRLLHEQYQIYLIFSQMEGFNLALMEAQSAGMVGVTNDVYYGPNELIKDGINGYIVGYNDVEAFAKRMIELCQDEDKLQNMSDNAYHLSERYSEANVWAAWQQLFNDFDEWCK